MHVPLYSLNLLLAMWNTPLPLTKESMASYQETFLPCLEHLLVLKCRESDLISYIYVSRRVFTKKAMLGVTLTRLNNLHVQRESSLYVLKNAIHIDRLRYIFYDLCQGLFFSCLSCLCILDHAWDVKAHFPFGGRLIVLQAGGDNSVLTDSYSWTTCS